MQQGSAPAAGRRPTVVTGFGLGAFADGIVLHQVLQWHHLVSGYRSADDLAGLQHNTFWDGVFHLSSWLVVLGGLVWLFLRREALPTLGARPFLGYLLIGWGTFNVVDQIVFHLLLEAHHIRMVDSYQLYDWGYTAIGVALILVGRALSRRRPRSPR